MLATQSGTNFASPVFILPLTISLAVIVCYLSQSAKKTYAGAGQELHITERHIDAIGTLKAKNRAKVGCVEG